MFQTVEIPLWLLVLILLFAAVTFASHFLFPSVRWYFRRRMERAVKRLNQRLARPIEPFKLARRHDMIQRLIYDPDVVEAVTEHAAEEGVPEAVAFQRARRYAGEIVPSFSAGLYFGLAIRVTRWLSQTLYDVRLDEANRPEIEAIAPDATVVFVMNHRSNMDYMLVTHLVADRSALSYAVGEWARVWPLSWLIRAMGAYFIRRRSRNPLYRRVLARYVRLATQGGVTQAMFPEGGLSLDGGLAPPKLGLLKYITEGAGDRDVVFVPVALNYDRVFEDRVLIAAQQRGDRKFGAQIGVVMGFILRLFGLWLTRRYRRFGVAEVKYGHPLSLKAFTGTTEELADALMSRIGEAVPVTAVPLIAQAVLAGPKKPAELAQIDGVERGLRILSRRHLIQQKDGVWAANPKETHVLAYYARSVAHHFAGAAETEQVQKT